MLAVSESDFVQLGDGGFTGVVWEWFLSLTWGEFFSGGLGGSSAENDEIEKRVSAESIGSVNGSTGCFTASEKTWNLEIVTIFILGQDVGLPIGGDTSHVVVDGWQNWNRLLSSINTSENVSSLANTWESFHEGFWRQVVQMKMNVITVWANTSSFENFHGHRS